ncbi:MAG: hypothetical protein CMG26_07435 [Candidatus Marinimicrobia bacterium]|nr:hypothetical protein [Candidatus Neomarinimicrobiota bacterium]|tara:strand:+ start:161 stop:652 length:492 start_codon:yes stop_codon:yes gene_type:complete
MNNYQLNSNWCIWYHSIKDNNWKNNSYKNIYKISNIYELKSFIDTIETIHLQNGMFFIMKDDIFPTWEDPDNRNGCCVSFKISNKDLKEQFDFIVYRVLSGDILKDKENTDYLNGISVIPKKEFNIVKLWLRDYDENYIEHLNIYEPYFVKDKSLIKKHELSD